MKRVKFLKIESGFYKWGPIKGYRTLAVTFGTEEDKTEVQNTQEFWKEIAKAEMKEFKSLIKKEKMEEVFESFTNPKIRGDKTRFLFRGLENELGDVGVRNQITALFNLITEEAIISDKITGEKYIHPLSFDIETLPLEATVENLLTKTPFGVQELSWFRKFNICLIKLNCEKMAENMKSFIGGIDAWKEIELHGQSFYCFEVKKYADCEFIEDRFIKSNFLDINPGRIYILLDDNMLAEEAEKAVRFAFDHSFRIDTNNIPEHCKKYFLD